MQVPLFLAAAAAAVFFSQINAAAFEKRQVGACGPEHNQISCIGNPGGEACSQFGYCGPATDPAYGGSGCQPSYGTCSSPDGTCGSQSSNRYTCLGSSFGSSCSSQGICGGVGSGSDCQPGYGDGCNSNNCSASSATFAQNSAPQFTPSAVTATVPSSSVFVYTTSAASGSTSSTSSSFSSNFSSASSTFNSTSSTSSSASTTSNSTTSTSSSASSTSSSNSSTSSSSSITSMTTSTSSSTSTSTSSTPTVDCGNRISPNGNPVANGTGYSATVITNGRFEAAAGSPTRGAFCVDFPITSGTTTQGIFTSSFLLSPANNPFQINADISFGAQYNTSQFDVVFYLVPLSGTGIAAQTVVGQSQGQIAAGAWNPYTSSSFTSPADSAMLYILTTYQVTSVTTLCFSNFQAIPVTCPLQAAIS